MSPQASAPKLREKRKVWIDPVHGWRDVPVYDGAELRPGCRLDGPLLIEERTTTAFVGPRDRLAAVYLNPHFSDPTLAAAVERALATRGYAMHAVGEGVVLIGQR